MKRLLLPLILLLLITSVIFVSCAKEGPLTDTLGQGGETEVMTEDQGTKEQATTPTRSSITYSTNSNSTTTTTTTKAQSAYATIPTFPTTTTAATSATTTTKSSTTTKAPTTQPNPTSNGAAATTASSSTTVPAPTAGEAGENETPLIPFEGAFSSGSNNTFLKFLTDLLG